MTVAKLADVPTILSRHGVPPDADADTLRRAIAAQGWRVTVEETCVRGVWRHTAQASQLRESGKHPTHAVLREMVRATGRTPAAALAFALAKLLEREA